MGLDKELETILEVSDKDILIGDSNKVKLFQHYL